AVAGSVTGIGTGGNCALASRTGTVRAKASRANNGNGAPPSGRRKRVARELVAAVRVVLSGGELVELCVRLVSTFSFLFIEDSFLSFRLVIDGWANGGAPSRLWTSVGGFGTNSTLSKTRRSHRRCQ